MNNNANRKDKGNGNSDGDNLKREIVLDQIDYYLIELLQENADYSGQELSELLKKRGHVLGDAAVNQRIKKLIDQKFILKKTIQLNYKKFGAPNIFFLYGKIKAESELGLQNFVDMAKSEPDVYEVYELGGELDYLIKVRAAALWEATRLSKRLSHGTGVEVKTLSVAEIFKEEIAMLVPRREGEKGQA